MYETIKLSIAGNVAWLTLNRPHKLNAFNKNMHLEIIDVVKKVKKDDAIRCLVITGEGRAFCSGADLSEVQGEIDYGEFLRKQYNPMILELTSLEKPVIAAVNGVAAGAGFSLALACDFRLVQEQASFIQAFIHIGLVPDSGNLYFLPRLIGYAKALELSVLGEKITVEQANELGLVTKIVSADRWNQEVQEFADKIAAMPTKAIGLIKRYMQKSFETDLEEMLENEANAQKIAGMTMDHKEGVQAFLEKRKAKFIGK